MDEFKCCSKAGVAFAQKSGSYVLVGIDGEMDMDEDYSQAKGFSSKKDYAAVKTADGWKLIDVKGNTVEAVDCDELCSSSNGIAPFKKGDSWGYIGVDDGVYVEATFDGVTPVNKNGYGAIKTDQQWRFIGFSRFQVNQGL